MHVDGFTANNQHLRDQYDMVPQGISADLIATIEGFTREECDQLGVDSQIRAAAAIAEGRFDRSLVPIFHDDGTLALDHDEFPRPGTTVEDLGKLAAQLPRHGRPRARRPAARRIDEIAPHRLPAHRRDQPRAPRRQLAPASSTAPAPCSSPRPTTRRPTA